MTALATLPPASAAQWIAWLCLCWAALAALSLSQDRHHARLTGRDAAVPRRLAAALRAAGTALLLLALWLCVGTASTAIGWVTWFGLISIAAPLVAFSLAWRPRLAVAAAGAAGLAGALILLSL